MCETFRTFSIRFIKKEIVTEIDNQELCRMDIEESSNLLFDNEIDIGNAAWCQLI